MLQLNTSPILGILRFDTSAYDAKMDPNDSILSIAERLAKYGGGGTDCSLPLVAANPKLVCIDLQPYQTVQACERADIMNIGGFSDAVFNVISAFLADNNQRFVAEVEAIEL
jgi:60 kDa SS-A/Ro ribonucleoprotein